MLKLRFMQSLVAIFALAAMLCQGTWVLAGTTGGLSGVVQATDSNGNVVGGLAGATVSATSVSQNATTTTDGSGNYSFVALAPDTYTLTVTKAGYDTSSQPGVNVFADQVGTVNLQTHSLKTIARIGVRASTSLVRPGQTTDSYSINAAQSEKIALGGGGGTMNSAWSALSTVPGVYVAPGQNGYIGAGPTLSIRGGDYDQIGYEIDGVPVNRSFDNYPSGPAATLGQQELQVYTGVPPANAQASGLSGYINQVIRTGTFPGFANIDLGIGGPTYYHSARFEVGGATPDRNFSYYLGIGGSNQDFRAADNFNGASLSNLFGTPLALCSGAAPNIEPSCYDPASGSAYGGQTSYFLGPYNIGLTSSVNQRDNVLNLHFGLPHKNGTKDDIQLLGMVNYLQSQFYTSTNDQGGAAVLGASGVGVPGWADGYQWHGATGQFLPTNYQQSSALYFFPNEPAHAFSQFDVPIPANIRDGFLNDQAIYKLQYTHNMGSNALFKVYGYSYYSDWLNTAPQGTYANYFGPASPDYELSSHTRGISGTLIDQINASNLINVTGSYTTANSTRANNTEFFDSLSGSRRAFARLVDSNNPTDGLCYDDTGTPQSCFINPGSHAGVTVPGVASLRNAYMGTIPTATGTCGTGPCAWYVVENGQYATFNQVKPNFYEASLTDDWHPTSRVTVNAGIRYDNFSFLGSDTSGTAARTLYYNAYNQDYCAPAGGGAFVDKPTLGLAVTDPCPAGFSVPNVTNPGGQINQSYTVFQPRLGATFTIDPRTVLRASYGRYAQAPNTAFEQYNALQQDTPALLYNTYHFNEFGFTTPDHNVRPEISNNYDFSIEHQFGRDVSVKLTPFLRKTQDEIQQFFLNQQTSFVSGLNVGRQTSEGFEFELDKGNFAAQGVSARLTFAYTNNYINFNSLNNGTTVITPINNDIANYNAYTKACASGGGLFGTTSCGTTVGGAGAAPCYTTGGVADFGCAAGSVANPYWNAPAQGLLNPNSNFAPFDILTSGVGTEADAFGAPFTATLVVNDHFGKWSVAPILQFVGGQKYGAPETTFGVAPDTCGATTGTGTTGDGRYPYGSAGGNGFDFSSCGQDVEPFGATTGAVVIPNPMTGAFDGIGAFTQPSNLQLHLQASYEASNNISLVANVSNILSTCFGGSKVPWSVSGACTYGLNFGTTGDIGNLYNPGDKLQPYVNRPYNPTVFGATFPLNITVNAKIKI